MPEGNESTRVLEAEVGGAPEGAEHRRDVYLPHSSSVGVKLRGNGGGLEIKVRNPHFDHGILTILCLVCRACTSCSISSLPY